MRCVLVHAALADARMWEPLIGWFQGHEPIGYDLRGHGQMDDAEEPWHHADDLLDVLDERPAVLVGAGLGARVALEVAVLRPELVRGLVLLSPVLGAEVDGRAPGGGPRAELVTTMRRRALAVQVAVGGAESPRVEDLLARLPGLRVPALVVAGEHGRPEHHATARAVARALEATEPVAVPGTTDLPSLEAPGRTGPLIARFLEGL